MTTADYLSKRYPTTCPHCGKEIYATRNLGMLAGWFDTGLGTCPSCDMSCELEYDREKDILTAIDGERSKKINSLKTDRIKNNEIN